MEPSGLVVMFWAFWLHLSLYACSHILLPGAWQVTFADDDDPGAGCDMTADETPSLRDTFANSDVWKGCNLVLDKLHRYSIPWLATTLEWTVI